MPSALKQFGEKATGWTDPFQITRLKLTALYAALLLTILIISSVTTHSFFSQRLERRFDSHLVMPLPPRRMNIDREARLQVRRELIESLIFVNGTLFVLAVGLSYVLAGLTLKPIRNMYDKQRRFISDASHELRTPLAILQTELENRLSDSEVKNQEKESAKSHLEEVGRMNGIIENLLLLSRLENDIPVKTKKRVLNLALLTDKTIGRFLPYAVKRDIALSALSTRNRKPLAVLGNEELLAQAIGNVLKNAIDYNRPGGKVNVSLKKSRDQVELTVSDTGIGIPESEITKLFDRFYRVDKSRSRALGGTGLGLSIAQTIIHSHGGSINITSKPDKGTHVTIWLPPAQT